MIDFSDRNDPNDHYIMQYALVENCRYWDLFDRDMREKIRSQGSKLHWEDILLILWEYSTGRNAFERGKVRTSAEALARLLNPEAQRMNVSASLQGKVAICASLVEKANKENITVNNQPVSISKLLWFLCADGWTMYDNNVAKALGVRNGGTSVCRMRQFYCKLSRIEFEDAASCINTHL